MFDNEVCPEEDHFQQALETHSILLTCLCVCIFLPLFVQIWPSLRVAFYVNLRDTQIQRENKTETGRAIALENWKEILCVLDKTYQDVWDEGGKSF